MQPQQIDDAEQVSILRGRQRGDQMGKIRHSALVMAEYQHKDDPKVRALSDTAGGIQKKIERLRDETRKTQQEFVQAQQKLEEALEQYIPEELQVLE